MAASFPAAVKNFSAVVNGVTKLVAALFNSPYDEVTAIETELGTDPAGSYTDVKTRLNSTTAFGAAVDKSAAYGAQVAATDGFVEGYMEETCSGAGTFTVKLDAYTDANADPVTLKEQINFYDDGSHEWVGQKIAGTFNMTVKKGDYWKIVITGTPTALKVWWRPLGTA